jgi:hypothetical protein
MYPQSPTLIRVLTVFVFLLGSAVLHAQTIENLRVTFDGQKVFITYDLLHPNPGEKFQVAIFGSHDNYTIPLSFVEGEVGQNIYPGKSKQVVWNVKNVLPPDFDGELIFKIRVTDLAAAITFIPLSKVAYKKGQPVDIQWTGGSSSDLITIQLYRGGAVKSTIVDKSTNSHMHQWQMPRNQKAGKEYTLRVFNSLQPNEFVTSQAFRIKPKVPIIVKLGVLAGVGAGAFILFSGGEEVPGPISTSEELPGPKTPK